MNRIVKQVLSDLEVYDKQTTEDGIKRNIKNIKYYLSGEKLNAEPACFLFEEFDKIEEILLHTTLNKKERGYIFLKLLENNLQITNSKQSVIFNYGLHAEELKSLGIGSQSGFLAMINSLDDELFTEKKETRNPILRHRLEEIIMEDTVATNKVIEYYKEFKILLAQQNKTEEDYKKLKETMLNLRIPESSIEDTISYLKSREKQLPNKEEPTKTPVPKKQEVEKKPSRKALRTDLANYYQPQKDIENIFDYQDYLKVLTLLKQLNYTEERVEEILEWLFLHAKKTFAYFAFLYDKLKYNKHNKELLEEIDFYLSNMWICNDEDYECAKEMVLSLFYSIPEITIKNYQYEMALIKKM